MAAGLVLIAAALSDGFNTIVVPRRVRRGFRLTNLFYKITWAVFSAGARRISNGGRREEILSVYGPMSLLSLLVCWAAAVIAGFGLLQWAVPLMVSTGPAPLYKAMYVSASALLMVAPADPVNMFSRWLVTIEAGLGFGIFGLVVGYLPVLYQSYSSRELRITLLDARAGSPPSAGELLAQQSTHEENLRTQLAAWEEWIAELLQEQLSYPMLAYFRSQHQNQSWLGALTAILDASAVVLLSSDKELRRQAYLTFAIGRHTLVDLATVFQTRPLPPPEDRLSPEALVQFGKTLEEGGTCLLVDRLNPQDLGKLRRMYEAYAYSLSSHFLLALPLWLPGGDRQYNWKSTAWRPAGGRFAVSDPFSQTGDEPD